MRRLTIWVLFIAVMIILRYTVFASTLDGISGGPGATNIIIACVVLIVLAVALRLYIGSKMRKSKENETKPPDEPVDKEPGEATGSEKKL